MKNKIKIIISISAVLVVVLLSIFAFSKLSDNRKSYMFSYPKIATIKGNTVEIEKTGNEYRKLPENPVQGEVRMFVDELLLGPETNRFLPIFSFDAKVEFCFLEKSDLYVGISESSILNLPDNTDINSRIELFIENIKTNFKNIEKVVLFIDGKVVNE